MTHLYMLRNGFPEGADMSQHCKASDKDHEHYAQLIIAVKGGSQHLRSSQAKGLQKHKGVPEPQMSPAAPIRTQ